MQFLTARYQTSRYVTRVLVCSDFERWVLVTSADYVYSDRILGALDDVKAKCRRVATLAGLTKAESSWLFEVQWPYLESAGTWSGPCHFPYDLGEAVPPEAYGSQARERL